MLNYVHEISPHGFKLEYSYFEISMHIWLNGKLEYNYFKIKMRIWLNGEAHP